MAHPNITTWGKSIGKNKNAPAPAWARQMAKNFNVSAPQVRIASAETDKPISMTAQKSYGMGEHFGVDEHRSGLAHAAGV
mgnify:CR=1 FL=1